MPPCTIQEPVLVPFDAHADTGDIEFGSLHGHGQPMRRLIESGAVRGDRFLQIGLRGYWPGPSTLEWMARQRMRSYEMTEIVARGLDPCLTEAFSIATDECENVFLSVDVDVDVVDRECRTFRRRVVSGPMRLEACCVIRVTIEVGPRSAR
ncbi:arginase family protein [Micromonospora sp. LOL_024]|uniref:arginase family protein n=1 Tax=Micromonospora sp. LOL_024 TaxID=3345412 RepID=UPI003A86A131